MKKEISPELIQKYLAGNCTEAEHKLIEEWYADLEKEPDVLENLTWQEQHALKANLLSKIKNNIQATEPKAFPVAETKNISLAEPVSKASFFYYASRVAAILVFICGLVFLVQTYRHRGEKPYSPFLR